jgi:hypothetical protein
MSEPVTTHTGAIAKFKHWVTGQLASEVPLDIALCEYGCRKSQCLQEEWEHCEHRLSFIKNMQTVSSEKVKAKPRKHAVAGKRKATRTSARTPRIAANIAKLPELVRK